MQNGRPRGFRQTDSPLRRTRGGEGTTGCEHTRESPSEISVRELWTLGRRRRNSVLMTLSIWAVPRTAARLRGSVALTGSTPFQTIIGPVQDSRLLACGESVRYDSSQHAVIVSFNFTDDNTHERGPARGE